MLVKNYMTRHPFLIEPEMSIVDAQRYMGEVNVRHLPVVGDGKRMEGLITRATLLIEPGSLDSLNVWEITRYLSGLKVKKVMIKAQDVVIINQDTPIEDAARIMVEKKIGCLPVLESRIVMGIITREDLLAHLTQMLATNMHGLRVTIRMPNVKGELGKLTAAISARGWGIVTCGGVPEPKVPSKWNAVIKLQEDVTKEEVVAVLQQVEGHEILDVRET